jgi:isoleucyl-tRNA synthetase
MTSEYITSSKISQPQRPLSANYCPKELEANVRQNWKSIDVKKLIEEKLRGKKKYGYVEGPPTLNGEPHVGHMRGRLIKDLWYRFTTMRGDFVDFRGGWDCQGLPVELEAEKELGLTGNKTANLKVIGEEKLIDACKKMLSKYHDVWKKADEMLGLSIDDSKAYWTYRDEYIEREWKYLRSAWNNGILEEGFRVTPFCPSCQTSLSAAEVALGGYQNLEDPSMYFKLKVKSSEVKYSDTFLVVWTTMPFTVVTDEMVGVKPDAEYCFVKVKTFEGKLETWIVGAERLEPLLQEELRISGYEVESKVLGRDLEGLRYEHPLSDYIPEQAKIELKSDLVHSVVAEDFVDVTTGSGLVHLSPANGEDDFAVSRKRGVPIFNPIDEQGNFNEAAGIFNGLFVRDADRKVRDLLNEKGLLLKYGKIRHDYPVCWRSGHRLLWLARRGYFYFVDRLGERAVEAASNVEYYYEEPRNRFLEIVKEKRPWCISRERLWGNPIPIWRCEKCGEKMALFSRKEIVERAKSLPDGENFELHRPWIDRIVIDCPKCGSEMRREPFVLDTWHNSGAAPYASLSDKEFEEYVPVPFLVEAIDQTRGWAYSLLLENVILKMEKEAPYRAFLFYGFVLNEQGEKMSKSKGNFIGANDLLSRESVDVARYYLVWKAPPIDSINFSFKEMNARPYQVLNTLYHMHVFYLQNSSFDGFVSKKDILLERFEKIARRIQEVPKQDVWLLSRVEALIDSVTLSYSNARYEVAARSLERFLIDELSQTYVPIIRRELWSEDEGYQQESGHASSQTRREQVYTVLGFALYVCDLLLHPISPYVTDFLATRTFGTDHLLLEDWPGSHAELRNERVEAEFDLLVKFVSVTNSARMKAGIKRRWPLKRAFYLASDSMKDLVLENRKILLEQTNILDVIIESDPGLLPLKVRASPNYERLAPRFREKMNQVAEALGSVNAASLYKELSTKGKAHLSIADEKIELGPADVSFSFNPSSPELVTSENFGIVVALDTSRDENLVTEGLVRDLARNLQALRKKRGFDPTAMLNEASIAGLGEHNVNMLEGKKDELAFLVRVKKVVFYPGKSDSKHSWENVEIDGMKLALDIN